MACATSGRRNSRKPGIASVPDAHLFAMRTTIPTATCEKGEGLFFWKSSVRLDFGGGARISGGGMRNTHPAIKIWVAGCVYRTPPRVQPYGTNSPDPNDHHDSRGRVGGYLFSASSITDSAHQMTDLNNKLSASRLRSPAIRRRKSQNTDWRGASHYATDQLTIRFSSYTKVNPVIYDSG